MTNEEEPRASDRGGAGEPSRPPEAGERASEKPRSTPSPEAMAARSTMSYVWEITRFVIISLLIVIPIRVYIAQPYIVSGASMEPTFENGEYLIADQLSYRFGEPERGDVAIVHLPETPQRFLIKRIVGLPGETLVMRNGTISIGEGLRAVVLKEPYVANTTADTLSVSLAEDEYYVLGDNRQASLDSRIFGPLTEDDIVGKALIRLFPPTRIDLFPGHTEY